MAGYAEGDEAAPSEEDPMAELLDDDELRTALETLEGWHGDRAAISRTVTMPAGDHPALLEELMRRGWAD